MDKNTLLIVEDNLVLQDGLRDILSYEGYEVITASNGREALEQMRQETPDLILSDIAMPEMDGIAFFQAVRSNPGWEAVPFVFLTARGEKEDVMAGKNMGAEDYLVKPLSRDDLVNTVKARIERSRQLHAFHLQQAYEASLTVLANAIEARDPYTKGHVERVNAYAQAVAAEFGLQSRMLDHLRIGSILHDFGKLLVEPASILTKPSRLNDEEWEKIKRHPGYGVEMIKDIPYLAPAVPVVHHHHEWWDGRGYPDHLAGEEIPLAARIVAVADAFDAMTSPRGRDYRKPRTLEEGLVEVQACSGSQFDPDVAAAFQRAWEAGKIRPIWEEWFAG